MIYAAKRRCSQTFVRSLVNASHSRTASITQIETLLDKVDDPVLAYLWRQICPLQVDQLPDRRGIIADLADFAQVLQPHLNGMQAPELCRLIEDYAVKHRRSQNVVRNLL